MDNFGVKNFDQKNKCVEKHHNKRQKNKKKITFQTIKICG